MRITLFKCAFFVVFLSSCLLAQAQQHLGEIQAPESFENVHVEKLKTDKHQSSFLIWVKDTVKPHYHAHHSECIYVLEGSGTFYLDGKKMMLKAGDFVLIPEGKIHSYKSKPGKVTKVLSIQTPEFFGKDRIFKETPGK